MDTVTKEQRSDNMRRIKSKNTGPEMLVRKYLFSKGLRYRLYDKTLPGTPDLVLRKYHAAVFINGCFWHSHEGCKYAVMPKTNTEYWTRKIQNNKIRDQEIFESLRSLGWNIIIVWECQLKPKVCQHTLERIYYEIVFENGSNNFNLQIPIPNKSKNP